jgi:predicted metal-dependent phosphoesterase TrpH
MHTHSNYSDSLTKVRNLLKIAKKRRVGVSITDHNAIGGVVEAYKNNNNVLVVPGIEVTCSSEGHILLYFYNLTDLQEFYHRFIKNRKSKLPYGLTSLKISELLDLTDDYNCVRSLAHPCSVGKFGIYKDIMRGFIDKSILHRSDAIEVLNGHTSRKRNLWATKIAHELNSGFTGGSDSHSQFTIGHIVTASLTQGLDEFLEAIVKKQNVVFGREIKNIFKPLPYLKTLAKHARYFKPYINEQIDLLIKNPIRKRNSRSLK